MNRLLAIVLALVAVIGPRVRRADEPRIIALSPAVAIILVDLGLKDQIVGRHGWDMAVSKDVPVCGDQAGLDYEAILRARPTHVYIQWGSRELPARLQSLGAERGWVVESIDMLTIEDIGTATARLGRELVPEGEQGRVDDLLARIDRAFAPRTEPVYQGRVLLLGSTSPPGAMGPGSFHHEILRRLGAAPALDTGGPWVALDAEDLIRLDPDAIVLFQPWADPDAEPDLGVLDGLGLRSLKEGRLAVFVDPKAVTPSTAMIGFTEELERAGALLISKPPAGRSLDWRPMPDTPDARADRQTFDPVQILTERFEAAVRTIEGAPTDAEALIGPSKRADLGDFQSNAAMPLGKLLGRKPRELAVEIASKVDLAGLAEPLTPESIAGPGFINIKLRPEALNELLTKLDTPELGLPAPAEPETVVVDLCGVNLAKQMHVGHLRATVIGDALARVFERLGAKVFRQNHVGDWGLPIAMVTRKLMAERDAGRLDLDSLTLDDLDRLYKVAQSECRAESTGLEIVRRYNSGAKIEAELEAQVAEASEHLAESKAALVKLQSHDPEVVSVWERIYEVTMGACLATCARLRANITEDATAGESTYRDELAGVVDDLVSRNIAEESNGALVVRVDGIGEPCIVRKSDGGFLYATTDMAAIRRRVQKLGGTRLVYAVDARQALHFRQVFGAAQKAGYAHNDRGHASLEHAAFGMVLGEDRRPFKTRSGENVRLSSLVDEAVERAGRAVAEKNPGLPENERARIAEAVGVAAIKYADLSNDRIKDYVFSFNRMLAFEGDTGPYLLYAVVRIRSIFRKLESEGLSYEPGPFAAREEQEKRLALELLRYPTVVQNVADRLEPHRLCAYLFELAGAFSAFFEACPVVRADEATRNARLRLCDLTGRVMTDGLETLGIPVLDRM